MSSSVDSDKQGCCKININVNPEFLQLSEILVFFSAWNHVVDVCRAVAFVVRFPGQKQEEDVEDKHTSTSRLNVKMYIASGCENLA